MLYRVLIAIFVVSLLSVVVILNLTTPISAGPFGVLALFVFLYLMSLAIVTFFIFLGGLAYTRVLRILRVRRPRQPLSLKHSYNFATVLALVPIIFIAMSSVGANGIYETMLVIVFAVFGCIYIAKRIN